MPVCHRWSSTSRLCGCKSRDNTGEADIGGCTGQLWSQTHQHCQVSGLKMHLLSKIMEIKRHNAVINCLKNWYTSLLILAFFFKKQLLNWILCFDIVFVYKSLKKLLPAHYTSNKWLCNRNKYLNMISTFQYLSPWKAWVHCQQICRAFPWQVVLREG